MGAIHQLLAGRSTADANTLSLLRFNGANGSTTFTDEKGNVWTPSGSTMQISTAQSQFGGASGTWTAANSDFISTPQASWNNFGGSNFTVELFTRPTSLAADRSMISMRNTGTTGWSLELQTNGSARLRALLDGTWSDTRIVTAGGLVLVNVWTHIALVRNVNLYTIYVNGISSGTVTAVTGTPGMDTNAAPLRMGRGNSGGENSFNGFQDEMRISNIARYVSNFTPPSAPFTV